MGIGFIELFWVLGFVVVKDPEGQRGEKSARREVLRRIYSAEVGVREATGKNDGPRVQQYLHMVGRRGNYSYCSAFVSWVFSKAGMAEPRTAWSPTMFPDKRVIWARAVGGHTPQTGDVFGIYFQELKRIGHCGFVDSWNERWCITVEANTSDTGSIVAADGFGNPIRAGPGEGVYRKKRLVKTIYKVAGWVSNK
ncbi:CHAP domain-containing protein [bacterium A37T11]|nr:CHAP domain-containing protein [bacterium A37T11]